MFSMADIYSVIYVTNVSESLMSQWIHTVLYFRSVIISTKLVLTECPFSLSGSSFSASLSNVSSLTLFCWCSSSQRGKKKEETTAIITSPTSHYHYNRNEIEMVRTWHYSNFYSALLMIYHIWNPHRFLLNGRYVIIPKASWEYKITP